jgi:hypothetical protein
LFASRPILGNGTYTVGFTFGTLDNITKIVVRNINDPLGIGFDDFFFNVPADVKITSGRVPGYLNGTTQKALLGADVALNATAIPGLFTGGSYAWTFAGSPTPLTPMNQASATVRWTTPGTYRATVTYTKGTQTATANLDVEVVIPTLLGFVATESGDRLTRDSGCNDRGFGVWYTLGCFERLFPGGPSDGPLGITWLAIAQIPTVTYLSNPAQSGIKFVQALSTYNKRRNKGNTDCLTARSSEFNVDSGWQLDTTDPYHNTKYFSEGSTLVMDDNDNPFSAIELPVTQEGFYSDDAHYVDDRFEIYVYYFTTNASNPDPAHPTFQRPLALPNSPSNMPIARLSWSWGGLVVFDYYSFPHSLTYTLTSNTVTGSIVATPGTATRSVSTNFKDLRWHPCGTGVTSNPIDTSYRFVEQL